MTSFLFQMPIFNLFILLAAVAITFSVIMVILINHFIPFRFRSDNNAGISTISAMISIIYGVLVGLTALYLINNMSYIDDAVQQEAHAVANIYRDSTWLKDPTREHFRTEIKNYLERVVNVEWANMKRGQTIDNQGELLIDGMATELKQYNEKYPNEVITPILLEDLKTFYNAREQRIHMSFSTLSPEIWVVILIGTIFTLGINYFLSMNFYLHLFSVCLAALMVFSMIFLLLSLDRPFQGEFVIESDTFHNILNFIETNHDQSPTNAVH